MTDIISKNNNFEYLTNIKEIRKTYPHIFCKFCNEILISPIYCNICGDFVCYECLIKNNCECCDTKITATNDNINGRGAISKVLNTLQIYCPINKNNGCEWIGQRIDVEKHLIECQKSYVECIFGCKENIILDDYEHYDFCDKYQSWTKILLPSEYFKNMVNDENKKYLWQIITSHQYINYKIDNNMDLYNKTNKNYKKEYNKKISELEKEIKHIQDENSNLIEQIKDKKNIQKKYNTRISKLEILIKEIQADNEYLMTQNENMKKTKLMATLKKPFDIIKYYNKYRVIIDDEIVRTINQNRPQGQTIYKKINMLELVLPQEEGDWMIILILDYDKIFELEKNLGSVKSLKFINGDIIDNVNNIIYHPRYDSNLLHNTCSQITNNQGHVCTIPENLINHNKKYTITYAHHVLSTDSEKSRTFYLQIEKSFDKNDTIICEKQRLNVLSEAEKESMKNYKIDIGSTRIIAWKLD